MGEEPRLLATKNSVPHGKTSPLIKKGLGGPEDTHIKERKKMRGLVQKICMGVILCLAAVCVQAQTTCNGAQLISPTNGSTLPSGAVNFTWCNANADYFLTIESVPGAHDIFFAFVGGVGPGAGQVSVTLGPACAAVSPIQCIPPRGETIHVTLDTTRAHAIISSFQYTFTAASSTPVAPALTSTAVASQSVAFSSSVQNVPLAATVAGANVNQGTVTFQVMDGAVNVGAPVTSGTLTNGTASIIYALPAGTAPKTYSIQANYSGGPNFQASSGAGTLIVNAASPTAAVTSTAVTGQAITFSNSIQNVTLTATIAGPSVNQGTVTFQVMDGANNVGSAVTSATVSNGVASVIYALPSGTVPKSYTIQAAYSGGTNFQASTGVGTLSVGADPNLTMTFHLPPDGGSAISSGAGALAVDYGELSSSTATNPVAIANFSYNNGALVTEAGVPAATVMKSARLFVDYSADRNSGFALVNPARTAINIQADLKDANGLTVASATVPMGPRSHTAMFVNQLLATLPSPFLGTVTLTSSSGFAAVNLSTATSGRSEMLFSALPVADLGNPPSGAQLILSQIVDGGGNPTQILLMNPSSASQSVGKVELFDDSGTPLALDFGAASGPQSTLAFAIAPDGMVKFATTGIGALRVGYAMVTVSAGPLPVGNGVFQFNQASGLVSQAGVPDSPQTTAARMYVEVASTPLSRNTGIAMVNRNATASVLTLTLDGLDGSSRSATLTLGPNEHAAKFITELFPSLPADFKGVLNIASTQPDSFLTLRLTINERAETIYSTLPVADLNHPSQGIQILPQIVNGGGYKTQSIVLSTSTGPGDVFINFFDEAGSSVPLAAIQ